MNVQSFWVEAPGRGAIRATEIPVPRAGEVLVSSLYSGISRGTEALVFQRRVPHSQFESMRCPHQDGTFSLPVKYGYISVGEVASEGPLFGRKVFCLHPHQTHFVVPVADVIPLPESLEPSIAVLAANLETAVNGVWDAQIRPDDQVTVIGAGVVGMLVAWRILQAHGKPVELLDVNPERAATATALGLKLLHPDEASDQRHVIIHASGSEAGLRKGLDLAADEGRIIEMSWFGSSDIALPLGEAFHSKRLTIRSSQVGGIPPHLQSEWTHRTRMEMVLSVLDAHPELACLVSGESHFMDLPETMARLCDEPETVLCHRIYYQERE